MTFKEQLDRRERLAKYLEELAHDVRTGEVSKCVVASEKWYDGDQDGYRLADDRVTQLPWYRTTQIPLLGCLLDEFARLNEAVGAELKERERTNSSVPTPQNASS